MFTSVLLAAGLAAVTAAQGWATYAEPASEVLAAFNNPRAAEFTNVAKIKRDSFELLVDRDSPVEKDPYELWNCPSGFNYDLVPKNPTCTANNCYRGFLNGRDGSPGKHCPSRAMTDCCLWYTFSDNDKYWFVARGMAAKRAPWTTACDTDHVTSDAEVKEVVGKINDQCACTIRHTVTVDITSPYYAMRELSPDLPICTID